MNCVRVKPIAPFRLDFSVWALRRSPANAVDQWDGRTYQRVLVTEDRPVAVQIAQVGPPNSPELRVAWSSNDISIQHRDELLGTVRKMLGLDVDLSDFYRLASANKLLARLARRFAGLKPPRLPTVFETLINGIACQQISLNVCMILLNRLCTAFGLSLEGKNAFPRPADLAELKPAGLKKLGFSGRKAEYILNVAGLAAEGNMDLESLADRDDESVLSSLLALRGIGRWTAEYVLLRGLGRLDTIPADDVGVQNRLKEWLSLKERPSHQAVRNMFPRVAHFRGLIYFLLLLDRLSAEGLVNI